LYNRTQETLKFKNLNELFRKQIRAFLLATGIVAQESGGNIQPGIMFPMISSEARFVLAKQVLEEEKRVLAENEERFFSNLKVGSMIESPSAVRQAGAIAQHADFIGLGTNDLKAATFVELGFRDAEEAVDTIEGIPPKLLRYIHETAKATQDKVERVCCCGVLASSPRYAPLLIGAGVNSLSVSRGQLQAITFLIKNITFRDARDLVEEALGLGTVEEVDRGMDRRLEELLASPGGAWSGLEPIHYLMTRQRSIQDIIDLGRTI
jgi:phosphoenolpyruvate-protein kinase (PTS system EI component)